MDNVIIVAGGQGVRMGTETPKQFLEINGMPILMHTILKFWSCEIDLRITLVLPESHREYWTELIEKYSFPIDINVVNGGDTRYQSVKNALNSLSEEDETGFIAIHDGVRPLVSVELIEKCFELAKMKDSAIPTIQTTDSLRRILENGKSEIVSRKNMVNVQTPQVFRTELLLDAYNLPFNENFTDDASIFESKGYPINLTEGEATNIKITTAVDLKIAEMIANDKL